MRIVKEAEDRKNEILDVANKLFALKGFDGTSITNILDEIGIARGTLYYHFKSKEDIMDALIERTTSRIIEEANKIASDRSIQVIERILRVAMALNISNEEEGKEMIDQMHKPQNALMHQKMQKSILLGITPIMARMVDEGVEQSIFSTPYPYESMEMVMVYAISVFDDEDSSTSKEESERRNQAFIFNMERLLGAKTSSFMKMMALFNQENSELHE